MNVTHEPVGALPDGRTIDRYVVRSGALELHVLTLGAIVQRLLVPDRNGVRGDVILGFDAAQPYLRDTAYHGAVVGRFATRIAHARFQLDGHTITLPPNDGAHHLHGGPDGFHRQLWEAHPLESGVQFVLHSADGESGYPGDVVARVKYLLSDVALTIEMDAVTTRATPINLTQHAYFNLSGDAATPIDGHTLEIAASRYLPMHADLLPTGEILPVADSPFDLRAPRRLADVFLALPAGLDHTFVTDREQCAVLRHPASGRRLDVHSTLPGLQVYTGNFLDGAPGRNGVPMVRRGGICLESHYYPDAVNQPAFPSTIIRPGDRYHARTTWSFSTE